MNPDLGERRMSYLAVPDDTLFLKSDEACDMVRLLRHVIRECETKDAADYAMPVDLATLRNLLRRVDHG